MKTKHVLQGAALVIVGAFIGYVWGILWGDCRTVNETTAISWARGHDAGCDDIVRGRDNRLVCEVNLQNEDDAVFIIRKEGANDDYK